MNNPKPSPNKPHPPMNTPREIIVNGLRYFIGSQSLNDKYPAHYKGFGGRKFTVRFHGGDLLRTDDLNWDYSFKNRSKPDTAVILAGWTDTAPMCAWQRAGEFEVFGPVFRGN